MLQSLLSINSNIPVPMRFDPGGYKMGGGRDLQIIPTVRENVDATRVVTVGLEFILVPKDFHKYTSR